MELIRFVELWNRLNWYSYNSTELENNIHKVEKTYERCDYFITYLTIKF